MRYLPPWPDTELGTVAPPCWRRVSASPLVTRYPVTLPVARSFIHVEDRIRVAATPGAPLRRAPGGAEAPAGGHLWCGARVGSGLRACARAGARRRRPPASNSLAMGSAPERDNNGEYMVPSFSYGNCPCARIGCVSVFCRTNSGKCYILGDCPIYYTKDKVSF